MTPDMEAVIAEVLAEHTKRTIKGCDCGWAELGKSHWDHQAAVILAELTEGGSVEWGLRNGDRQRVERCYTERYAKQFASESESTLVSRVVGPWEVVTE